MRLPWRRRPLDPALAADALARHVPGWRGLATDARSRLTEDALELARRLRWEAAQGFRLDETMRAVVAGNAALLTLELDGGIDNFHGVSSVILHPGPITLQGVVPGPVPGLVTEGERTLDGEAHHAGPVVLSWSAVRHETRHPAGGLNVVLHEFAHRLDMLDGLVDGTPPLGDDPARLARWVEVCTHEYRMLSTLVVAGGHDPVLRSYGAQDVGEFFAVATEVFFCRPVPMRELKPALYAVLRDFYGQDPAGSAVPFVG